MADQAPLLPLVDALRDLTRCLADAHTEGVLIGGIASSLLGRPRMTRDVDILVLIEDSERPTFVSSAAGHGIEPRREDALEFAERSRVLLLKHRPTDINIDVILATIPFEQQVIKRASKELLADVPVLVPTPEDLIIMKAVARRPQDLEDIRGIAGANPNLDRDYVKRVLCEFATEMDVPEIAKHLEELL